MNYSSSSLIHLYDNGAGDQGIALQLLVHSSGYLADLLLLSPWVYP